MQIKTHFRTTLRHLWRNRVFTGLNILGLANPVDSLRDE